MVHRKSTTYGVPDRLAEVAASQGRAAHHSESCLGSAGRVEGGKALPASCALDACAIRLAAERAAQLEARLHQCTQSLQHDWPPTAAPFTYGELRSL